MLVGHLPWLLHQLEATTGLVERLAGRSGSSGAPLSSTRFLSLRCSAELPHDGLSCSRSSSTACFGAHADSARIPQFAAWHCFPQSTSLCQVVAFSRAFLKATLRLATGSMAPQTPQLCASQHQLFPTLMHNAFEHWCSHETRLKTLVLLPIPEKGAAIMPHKTYFIGSGWFFLHSKEHSAAVSTTSHPIPLRSTWQGGPCVGEEKKKRLCEI